MSNEIAILLFNAPLFEKNLLENEPGILLEEEDIPDGANGEPITFTIFATAGALSIIAAYLLRKHKNKSFEETVEVRKPDGSVEIRKVKWKETASEPGKSDALEKIIQLLKQAMGLNTKP